MITFLDFGQHGRLTNQLYQYAVLKSVGWYNNYEVRIPDFRNTVYQQQPNRLSNFNLECEFLTPENRASVRHYYYEPYAHEYIYHPEIFEIQDFTSIRGFFQHPKYLERYADRIRRVCSPKPDIMAKCIEEMNRLRHRYPKHDFVCISVRRGDALPYWPKVYETPADFMRFIEVAISYFKNAKFLIFTGGNLGEKTEREAYEWCEKMFIGDQYLLMTHNDESVEMGMMSLCDHYIISFYTSFSQWPMFLNESSTKRCILKEGAYKSEVPPFRSEWIYL